MYRRFVSMSGVALALSACGTGGSGGGFGY